MAATKVMMVSVVHICSKPTLYFPLSINVCNDCSQQLIISETYKPLLLTGDNKMVFEKYFTPPFLGKISVSCPPF